MLDLHKYNVDFWSNPGKVVEKYWNDVLYINKSKLFAQKLIKYKFSSIYEVGMCNGRNLKYIGERFPNVELGGCDINKEALDFAKKMVPRLSTIDYTDILSLETDKKFDIVFTHGVLVHIDPDKISLVLDKIINKANKYIIHIEKKETNNIISRGPKELGPQKIAKRFVWSPNISELYEKRKMKILEKEYSDMGMGNKNISTYLVIER